MPTYTNTRKYLLVELNEQYSLDLVTRTIHEIAEGCQEEHLNKVLVDLTAMQGSPSIIDRYETGVKISEIWGSKIKAATVAKMSIINFMAETVAVNRGAKFKVFTEINPALEWLEVGEE